MSTTFQDLFGGTLRTKAEFTTHLSDAATHQATQAHTDYQRQLACLPVYRAIREHFNNKSLDTTDPLATSLNVDISALSADEKTDLQTALTAKGYSITDNTTDWDIS